MHRRIDQVEHFSPTGSTGTTTLRIHNAKSTAFAAAIEGNGLWELAKVVTKARMLGTDIAPFLDKLISVECSHGSRIFL